MARSHIPTEKRNKIKLGIKNVVSKYFLRGNTHAYIVQKVIEETGEKISISTCHNYCEQLKKEWQEVRVMNTEIAVSIELQKIAHCINVLWDAWHKSITDYSKTSKKQKALIPKQKTGPKDGKGEQEKQIEASKPETTHMEQSEMKMLAMGNVSYLTEIRFQQIEYRKLCGLYAAEKVEAVVIPGDIDLSTLPEETIQQLLTLARKLED